MGGKVGNGGRKEKYPPNRSRELYSGPSGVHEELIHLCRFAQPVIIITLHTHPQTVNTRFSVLPERVDHWYKNVICYDLVVVNPNKR